MNIKRHFKIDIVYVFHCCALADLPWWIKQSLQQRLEDWQQRSKTLVDQIHAVDPYYVPTNEYRFIGQASYADIAAGRTNSPSSRNCSPYRYQREATPLTMTAQVLPAVMRVQKLTVEYPPSLDEAQVSKTQTQENNADLNKSKSQLRTETCVQTADNRGTIDVEECQQDIPKVIVESSVSRRGRSPTRKTNLSRARDPKTTVDQEGEIDKCDHSCPEANSKQEMQTKHTSNSLTPCEERRGRSPSPIWVPGSTSYADILRGSIQTTQINNAPAQPPKQKMVILSGESQCDRAEVLHAEQVTVDANVDNKSQQVTEVQQAIPTQQIQMENVRVAETYCQPAEISTEEENQNYAESESTNWTDEALQDYNVLQHVKPYEDVSRQQQPTEIYDYMIPETMPELVGFIGSHLGTYPVSSYVYAPSGHHQQVQQLDTINLNPYNNGSLAYAPEHYVAQTTYLSTSAIYQQTPMQQPTSDIKHATAMLREKSVEMPVIEQPEISKDAIMTECIDKLEQQKSISNVETSTMNSTMNKTERNTSSLNNVETKGQTFSYAQILSHGLSPRITSTRIMSESPATNHGKERSNSPKESLELSRELSPLQELKFEQDPQTFAVTFKHTKQSEENNWDMMKKREVKKRQQQPNDKTQQKDEGKSRKSIDKSKQKQKKEKLSLPKQLKTQDEPVSGKIVNSPAQEKEKKSAQQEKPTINLADTSPSQEKKRKQKKKKIDKSVGDEIDKALKEIEDMDKQKIRFQKDKPKEQNKEQNKLLTQDSLNEMEKCKDEIDKNQSKSGEKSKKLGKIKEVTKVKETMFMEHVILPSQIKASDQSILKDNVEDKKNTKDTKVSDSKNKEEEIQKDIFKEPLKNQFQINNNSDKPDDTTKCKNKSNKNTKTKERSKETLENEIQDQSDVLSNKKRDMINNADKNTATEVVKLLATQKVELENTNEKTNTKIESISKHKDISKKEENRIKIKELKLKAEDSNMNQEKFEIKEITENKSLESIKPLTDIKDFDLKAFDVTKITSDVNENTKSKTNSRKRDKASKSKIKSEVAIDISSAISTNKVLNEIKINLNDREKYNIAKSEQTTDGGKIAEAAIVEEISKEIVSVPKTLQQIAQEIDKREVEKCQTKTTKQKKSEKVKPVQDKSKRKEDDTEISQLVENKSIEKKDESDIESLIAPTIETVQEQSMEDTNLTEQHVSVFNNSCLVQSKTDTENNHSVKIEREDIAFDQVNKCVPETVPKSKKKNKSKNKAIIQSTASIHGIKSTENSELKDVVKTAASAIVELVTSINEEVSCNETMKLTKDNAKLRAISTSAEKSTVPKTDLVISTASENVEITSTIEILSKESEMSSEVNNIAMKEKYQNIKSGKLDLHHQESIIKHKDFKIDINNKDSSIEENFLIKKQDVEKSKDVSSKERTTKPMKRKGLPPKHTVEQMKQSSSFYDKFQEEIVFKDNPMKKEETSKLTTSPKEKFNKNPPSLAKIDNVNNEKIQESPKMNEVETKFDSKVSSDSVDKTQVHEKHIDEIHNNNLESEQPSSTGKALIIEKMVTTVTTTTSVPGSVKVKPPDVKSVKSVEIIENIPLPKIVGSKITELITLRPETVEASLTTTYARMPNDSLVSSYSVQSDQAAISQKVGLTSANSTNELVLLSSVQDTRKISENRDMSKESPPVIITLEERQELIAQLDDNMEELRDQLKVEVSEEKHENNNMKEENTTMITMSEIIVVDTVPQNDNIIESQNINNSTKNDNIVLNDKTIQADSSIVIEEKNRRIDGNEVNVKTMTKNVEEAVDEKVEFEMKYGNKCIISKVKSKEISENTETKKQIVPEYFLELIKPYAMDRHAYNHAESNFYRYFKVVKIVKEPQPPAVIVIQTRPESVERIVQESVMRPVKSASQEMYEDNYRRHALIIEAPKYPITSFYEFESQWVKIKSNLEKSVSVSSDDFETTIKTVIGEERQIVEEKEAVNTVSDLTDTPAINVEKFKTIETNDNKDKKTRKLQESVHSVSDDSWMITLDESMIIEDDFDNIFNPEENSINKTVNSELIDVESQDRRNEIQVEEKQSKIISEVLETPSCVESVEEIQESAITLVNTSINNIPFDVIDSINITNDSISQAIPKSNISVELSAEKISDNQLTDLEAITDIQTNIQTDEIITKNDVKTEQKMLEIKTTQTKIPSIHLKSDDTWMALLKEEIIIDDNFDELETEAVKYDQIEKRRKKVEKKEPKIEQQKEEIEKEKLIIKKQEDKIEQKKLIVEEQEEIVKKEEISAKSEEETEKKKVEKREKEVETKEPKTEVLNNTSLTEIAVKDEYHTGIKDIQNETLHTDEKQNDTTKNQPKKKKELKHVKVTKTKDQAKTKTTKKQSDIEIKTNIIEGDLSLLQSNLEEHKVLENKTDSKIKETEKSLVADEQAELYKDKSKLLSNESKSKSQDVTDEEKPKREERKLKSDKKFKKQNQKSELTLKEKSATVKHESNIKKDDNIVLPKTTEIESDIFETSPIVQKQQESEDDMPKHDNRLNPNVKSWAAIVGTRGMTEITVISKDDSSLNTQTPAIIQNTNDSVTNIVMSITHDSCEIPSKEEALTMHSSLLENQMSKNVNEESKTMVDEIVKPIAEKSIIPSKQLKEGKSYAQVTASLRGISPQISQEETYSVKPISLTTDHLAIDVKTLNEVREHFSAEKLQSPEKDNKQVDEMIAQQSSDHQTVTRNFISQEESIPWVDEVEKETLAVSTISVSSINITDETCAKLENTWAAIVGKKSAESLEINDISNLEQNLLKSKQIIEQWSPVQIYVEEAPKQEPIKNLVQVDEQGFMEFVNRKELRSRRSRSRSRSARRDNKVIIEISNSVRNKEIKRLDIKSENSENVQTTEEIKNKTKQFIQKHEDEQKTVNENDELTKIIEEKNPKSRKNKSKKNKFGKDHVKWQAEVNEQKELKHIENSKEDKKSENENEIQYNKTQLENIEKRTKETQLIKHTEYVQENVCKDMEPLSITDQDNVTKSKKKKNKKGKFVIEQLIENISDSDKNIVIAEELENKIKSPIETKIDDKMKIKLEEAITADIHNIATYPENEETPAEIINKQENIKQVMIVETIKQEDTELIVDELKNTEACQDSHLEKVEKNVMREEEIPKLTKMEKRKQKKKAKIVRSKSTDLSDDINIVKNTKTKDTIKITEETVNTTQSKDKIDDAFVLKKNNKSIIQSVRIGETEKPLGKSETVIENETSLLQITPIKDKQKVKSKSKSKKEKRQHDDKTKSQNFITIVTADSKEILPTAGNTENINLSKDKCEITQTKKENVKNQVLDDKPTLESPKDIIDKNDFSVITETVRQQEDIKELKSLVSSTEREVNKESIKIKDLLPSEKNKQKLLKKQDTKAEDKKEQQQNDSIQCAKKDAISLIDKTELNANKTINVTNKEINFKTKSSIDFTEKEENNIVSIEFAKKIEISNNEKEEEINNKHEINEKQIETNDATKLTINSKIELNEQIIDQKNVAKEPADNVTLTEKIELLQIEESHPKPDDTSKLYDITVNNNITKIESILLSDKTNNYTDELDTSAPINHVSRQIKPSCDSINAVIKHSPPSDKLSSTVQQSFEDEDKLKRIASNKQESSDLLIEHPKSKVQFYIADEILVLNPDRRKYIPSTSFLQEQPITNLCSSWFLSIDDGFWPDKRSYHEAERNYFESLALNTKKNLSRDSKRDFDDRHRPRDDDNSGGDGGSGRSRNSCANSRSLLGTPQTECMIADLPGGICSWSDYSTYLSSESERTMDYSLSLGTIEDPILDLGLILNYSLSSDVQPSSPEFLSSSPPSRNSQTESRMESLTDAEVTPREYSTVSSSSSSQSPDYPSTCTRSSTFAHLRPQSKLHLGNEMRERSVQQCSPNGKMEKETAKGEAESRIRRIQVRLVFGLVLVEFVPSPLPYVYIHVHVYILVVFSYLDCLPLIFRSLSLIL